MDPLAWNKKFEVLSISRHYLQSLGFSPEGIKSLTDEAMQAIASTVRDNILFASGINFDEEVRFIVACAIVENQATGGEP